MKAKKKFDAVKMMREIRDNLSNEMKDMNFEEGGFDAIWSEGAVYLMGFEKGLRHFKGFVKKGGYIAVSDAVWLKPDPPESVIAFWKDYPEIDTVANKIRVIEGLGLEDVGHFILPPSSWIDDYYKPLAERIAEKERNWKGNPVAEDVLAEARAEIDTFEKHMDFYSYGFFVMRHR